MAGDIIEVPSSWKWSWDKMCGDGGLELWSPVEHDLGLCFQQLFLQIPVLSILAVVSAYYSGRHIGFVLRGKLTLFSLNVRCFTVICLAVLPVIQFYIDLTRSDVNFVTVDYFLSATQLVTWLVHFSFLSALKTRLGSNPRGPVGVCVIWSLVAVLSVISFRSHVIIFKTTSNPSPSVTLAFACSLVDVILQFLYTITLFISDGANYPVSTHSGYTQIDERQPLLGGNNVQQQHAYSRILEEREDPSYLGVAMEDSTVTSRLLFYWVNPLMEKGVDGKLTHPDDLFDLPVELSCNVVSIKLDKALIGNVDKFTTSNSNRSPSRSVDSYGSISTPNERDRELNFSPVEVTTDVTFSGVRKHNVSLLRALHTCFAVQFYGIGVLKFIADCAGFASPLLLNRLVSFIENKDENIEMGYLYAGGLFFTTLIVAFCNAHFNFLMSLVGLKIRASIVTTIYRKTLTVGGTLLSTTFSVGEIVNFMSTDTDRIVNSCPSFHSFWSIPFQLAVTLFLLYQQVGLAFLAGVIFSIILIPINKYIANKIGELSTKMMARKDERVKMMTELLRGIRTVKLHVWEDHFMRLITKLRDAELKYLKGRKYLDALCVYFWATTPVLISILTFTTYVLMGNKLSAATVFTTIALLNMLIGPLNAFPWVLNGLTEAWVSIKRIQRLLDLPDLDLNVYYNQKLFHSAPKAQIIISNGYFNWGGEFDAKSQIKIEEEPKVRRPLKLPKNKRVRKKSLAKNLNVQKTDTSPDDFESSSSSPEASCERVVRFEEEKSDFYLSSINLIVKKGQFIGIMGHVGSGKSSLLASILADMAKLNGDIALADLDYGFGFVTQQPWLQHGTLRDNILFGKAYDDARYRAVLDACCLSDDIHLLPRGDMTGIGEGGMTLSGGQRARVALARAVYQDKSLYILDDILAAVDAKVAKHIYEHCIMGILSNKTRILCTHHTQFLLNVDHLIVMQNGLILQQGKPSDVLSDEYFLTTDLEYSENEQNWGESRKKLRKKSVTSMNEEEPLIEIDKILETETKESGTVDLNVYGMYWKAVGHFLGISIIIAMLLMQSSRNMTDWWLSYWVSNLEPTNITNLTLGETNLTLRSPLLWLNEWLDEKMSFGNTSDNGNIKFYLTIYATLAGMNTIFTLFRAFLFAYGGIHAACRIHRLLLRSIVRAKVTFFDISPLGRILNRFSSDTYTIDDSLPFIANILFAQFFGVIGSVILTIYGLPWLCLILVPLVPIYHWLQYNYRKTSRELKRLSSITLSPVYSHFNETLQGLSTIRAFRATQRFRRDNEENVEYNLKAQFASAAAGQWLGLRLQFIGVAMVTGVGFIAIIQHQFDVANPGFVGLALSYALSVTGLLSGLVNAFTETEREMIAVERVNQYIEQVEPEKYNEIVKNPPYAWPSQGVVVFNEVVLRYRPHLAPALKGISFETRPSEKIGVVGRTGAGKSSLMVALFRLAELYSGSITIDTVNISYISLQALRSRLSIIPQEPFLFSGTVRQNIDPLHEFRAADIWTALQACDLTGIVKRMGGLDSKLTPGGQNLSVGQRQLMCLARAVLHKSKILCIDEATANVDYDTDRQIQQTIRSAFRRSTVITIAHRVQTVMDCDRVIVMSDGQIVEFDSPDTLMQDPTSNFYKLVATQE